MSNSFELIMPKMGESIAEATILKWLKKEGDTIELDEAVLEIATDKVDSEVPSPVAGTLQKLMFNEGDVVQVGKVVALISTSATVANTSQSQIDSAPASAEVAVPHVPVATATNDAKPAVLMAKPASGRFYSPLVLNIAKTEGISMDELERVSGSGESARVTKADILSYIKTRGSQPAKPAVSVGSTTAVKEYKTDVPTMMGDEIVEMDRMRKLIAEHMVMSKHVSPHVTSFVEADVTRLWNWRAKMKDVVEKRDKEKLTFTPIFLDAIIRAIKDFPNINVSLSGDKIIKRGSINIGMAAALPSGNLIVPVIKNADELSLLGLTKKVNDLANRARTNKLLPEEIQGGTYTVTNVGTFGNLMGTPIINQPQVAIMATGAIVKKPAVVETPEGDVIAIRYKMFLSHSYDHRIVDGALGGMFVRRVADYLENWDMNRSI